MSDSFRKSVNIGQFRRLFLSQKFSKKLENQICWSTFDSVTFLVKFGVKKKRKERKKRRDEEMKRWRDRKTERKGR